MYILHFKCNCTHIHRLHRQLHSHMPSCRNRIHTWTLYQIRACQCQREQSIFYSLLSLCGMHPNNELFNNNLKKTYYKNIPQLQGTCASNANPFRRSCLLYPKDQLPILSPHIPSVNMCMDTRAQISAIHAHPLVGRCSQIVTVLLAYDLASNCSALLRLASQWLVGCGIWQGRSGAEV